MANKFQVKRTAISGRTPNTTSSGNTHFIDAGELALNLTDRKMFSSNGTAFFEVGANLSNLSVTSNATISAIVANGSVGGVGQTLTSNGTGIYWAAGAGTGTVTQVNTGVGLSGGPITSTGTISVVANSGIVANTTGVFANPGTGLVVNTTGIHVNSTYIGTLASNSATYLGGNTASDLRSYSDTQAGAAYTNSTAFAANADNISSGTVNALRLPATVVQNTDSRTLSGNLVISGTYFNPSANTIQLGNSTQRWVLSANTGSFSGAVSGITTLAAGNTTITGFANASVSVNSALLTVGTSFIANTTGAYHASTINAASFTTTNFRANTTGAYPLSNTSGTALGSTTQRWVVSANTINTSGLITGSAGANISGTSNLVDVFISGNLTVSGTTTYINTTNLNIGDNIVTLNADLGAIAPTENAGLEINRGSSASVSLLWNETSDSWTQGNTNITGYANATVSVNSALLTVGTNFIANTTGTYHTGIVNAASHTTSGVTANTTGVYPSSNTVGTALGSTTKRWVVVANTGSFTGQVEINGNSWNTATGAGALYLDSSTGNRIDWNVEGVAAPSVTTRSAGTKLVLYPAVAAAAVDFGLGIETNHMWFSVADTGDGFKWYANTTEIMSSNTTGAYHIGNVNAASFGSGVIGAANGFVATSSLVTVGNSTVNSSISGSQIQGNQNDTVSVPYFSWSSDNNTGLYRPGADVIGVTTGGVERIRVGTTLLINTSANASSFTVGSSFIANATSLIAPPSMVIRGGGATAEGGQITIGYGNNLASAITGQQNNTFNLDMFGGNTGSTPLLRAFFQNNDGTTTPGFNIANTGKFHVGSTAEQTDSTFKVTGTANVTTSVNSALLTVGTNFIANTTGLYHTGLINAASISVGSGSFIANATATVIADPLTANGSTGTAGHTLHSNGATGSPYWAVDDQGVTSVTGTSPVVSSGGNTPAISLAAGYGDTLNPYASKTAKFVLAAPNASAGVPTFRAIVASDIPTLNQSTTGSAATLTTGRTIALSGAATGTATSFNGSANITIPVTALNASNLTSGTIPDARISGSYTGMTNLTGTGNVDFSRFLGNAADTALLPSFSWTTDPNSGIYSPGADQVGITTGGVSRLIANTTSITSTLPISASTFTGALTGNATTATTLQTARTLTIGSTGKTFNGSANVAWSLAEIGAQAAGNYVTTDTTQTVSGIKTFSNGFIPGSTQGYPNYELLLDFGSDVANTWRRIVSAVLVNSTYSTIGFKIEITDPQANHAVANSVNSLRNEVYYVACVRTQDTVLNTPDACYVTGPGNRIRATKTATGTYEIHIQNDLQFREYRINISVYAVNYNNHVITYYNGDTATTGTAQYNSTVSTTQTDRFQNIQVGYQITSNVATGTAPLIVTSTTRVANLNVATAGTADTLTTARTLTIGSTGKTFNGSANVAWSLAEIGAQASGNYVTTDTTQTITAAKTFANPEFKIGSSNTANYISFYGTTGDGPGSFNHTYIGEYLYGGTESSELILFKGNDIEGASGPDRIRHIAVNHLFQTYTSPLSGTFATVAASTAPLTRMFIGQDGNVGIGTITPGYKLEVNGSFAATSKSFLIDHPTKEGKKLRHGSLEGPEHGVYVRGKINGNIIELPEYWTKLVDQDSITVQLTAIGKGQSIFVEKIEDNKVYVSNEDGTTPACFYLIQAERIDIEKMEVEI